MLSYTRRAKLIASAAVGEVRFEIKIVTFVYLAHFVIRYPQFGVKMKFDPQAIFANLAEKEKIKGHHSPEGRAIRTLSRALNGYSSGNLSGRDVLALCVQTMEDWLKTKLKVSPWSTRSLPALAIKAVQARWITRLEAVRLQKLLSAQESIDQHGSEVPGVEVESALKLCIELVERHW